MKLVYTAGAYNSVDGPHGIVLNIRHAEYIAVQLWQFGFAVICPHKNTALLDGSPGTSRRMFLDGDLVMLKRCDAVVMLQNWRESPGACEERETAVANGIPVYEWPTDIMALRDLAKETVPA